MLAKDVKIFVFGSRATGLNHPFSGIDILIEPPGDLPPGFLSQHRENLEQSNLEIKVGLVESKTLAQSYRDSVDRDKIATRVDS